MSYAITAGHKAVIRMQRAVESYYARASALKISRARAEQILAEEREAAQSRPHRTAHEALAIASRRLVDEARG